MAAVDPRQAHRHPPLSATAPGGWDPADYAANAAFVPALGAAVFDLLAARRGEAILDLGCGDGVLTERIATAGADVLGVDADPAMRAAAAARGLRVEAGDGQSLGYIARFDAVFSNAALHWMPNARAVARGVFRALKPGGRFVGECGGHGNVAAIRVALRAVLAAEGLPWAEAQRYATAQDWAATLAEAGFVDIDAALIPRPTPLPGGIAEWLRTFRAGFLHGINPAQFPALFAAVEALLAPMLRDSRGHWTADYVRLRFTARRPA